MFIFTLNFNKKKRFKQGLMARFPTYYLIHKEHLNQVHESILSSTMTTDNFNLSIRTLLKEHGHKVHIWLVASPDEAYELYEFANGKRIDGLIVSKIRYPLKGTTYFDRAFARYCLATTDAHFTDILDEVIEEAIYLVPIDMSIDSMLELLFEHAPPFIFEGKPIVELVAKKFEQALSERKNSLKNFISVCPQNTHCEFINIEYGPELIQRIAENPGIYCLVAPMGHGKTQSVVLPLFEHFCQNGSYPILAGAKRILMGSLAADERHYQQTRVLLKSWDPDRAKPPVSGTIGVVNTLFHHDFDQFRAQSNVLLIEEYEDVQSHIVSSAAGKNGSLKEKAKLKQQLSEQIQKSRHVIIADAMLSNFSVNELANLTGQKIYICRPTDVKPLEPNEVLFYRSESHIIAKTSELIQKHNRNVVTFTDCSHNQDRSHFSELETLYSKFTPSTFSIDKYTLKDSVESENTSFGEGFLRNLDNHLRQYQHVLISPAINSGVSIQNKHFSDVAVIGYRTLLPNQLIQSLRRVRDAKAFHLFIDRKSVVKSALFFSKDEILTQLIANDHKDDHRTQRHRQRYEQDPAVHAILERMLFENNLRKDNGNHVLLMLELLGYTIREQYESEKTIEIGKKLLSQAKTETAHEKQISVTKTPSTADSKAKNKHQDLIKALREFYRITEATIPEEIYLFDDKGKGRARIKNFRYARHSKPTGISLSKANTYDFIQQFFSTLKINPHTFKGTFYSTDVELCVTWLNSAQLRQSDFEQDVKATLSFLIFDTKSKSKPNSSYSLNTIKSFLKTGFGLEVERLGRPTIEGQRVYEFCLKETEISKKTEEFYRKLST